MKQVLQSYRTGELWLAEVPVPACEAGGVVVRTRASLVSSGTEKQKITLAKKSLLGKAMARPDLVSQVLKKVKSEGVFSTFDKVSAKLDEPIPLGYSAAGEVIEVGRQTVGFAIGARVAVAGAGYANHSEFNFVPANLCAAIPEGVSFADASFATIGAIALQGVRQADPLLGERVVVVGLGLLGLLTVQILKANGCAVLGFDPDDNKVALAQSLGADAAVSTEAEQACAAFTGGRGADAVIITAATPSHGPIESAAAMSRHRGRVVAVGLVGLNVPRDAFYQKELDLRMSMSYGPGRYDPSYEEGGNDYPFAYVRFTEQRNMESFLYLVQQGKVTPSALVTHRIPFDDALDAYSLLAGKGPPTLTRELDHLGILLEYPEDAAVVRTTRTALRGSAEPGPEIAGVGFIGAGTFAKGVLLPQLVKLGGIALTGVCTSTGRSAQQTADRYGFRVATTDASTLLDDPGTNTIFVATRHSSHASFAAAALRAGKNVFVEKPLCLSEEEIETVAEALASAQAEGLDPCLMVGFNRRFSPHAAALKEAFASRNTPMVVSYRVNAGSISSDSWIQDPAVGGGRIIGEVCHFVDFCSALIGRRPVSVAANSIASARTDVVSRDSCAITINYEDGSLAVIQYLAEGHKDLAKERCEVFAGGKSAVMDDFRTTVFYGGGKPLRGKQSKGFSEELKVFLEACRSGGSWPISWESLVDTHRACFASIRSLETGRTILVDSRRGPLSGD
jgi:predicted dehydrogenase/threonine dehydrogenase-like Zn-dependent dehydrogenase